MIFSIWPFRKVSGDTLTLSIGSTCWSPEQTSCSAMASTCWENQTDRNKAHRTLVPKWGEDFPALESDRDQNDHNNPDNQFLNNNIIKACVHSETSWLHPNPGRHTNTHTLLQSSQSHRPREVCQRRLNGSSCWTYQRNTMVALENSHTLSQTHKISVRHWHRHCVFLQEKCCKLALFTEHSLLQKQHLNHRWGLFFFLMSTETTVRWHY